MSKKQQYTLEYPVRCSPTILYEFLSTPSGLQEWFADKVDERDGVFSFSWNGSDDTAEDIGDKFNLTRERVRQIKDKAITKLKTQNRTRVLRTYLGS